MSRSDLPPTPVRAGVLARWHRLRRELSLVSAVVALVLAAAFGWPAMALAGTIVLAMAVDAHFALKTHRRHFVLTLVVDITASGFVFALVGVPPLGIASATAYFVVLVAVLGRSSRAWPIGAYAIIVGLLANAVPTLLDLPTQSPVRVFAIGLATVTIFSVAMTVVVIRFASLIRDRLDVEERRTLTSEATSIAARALVAQDDPRALAIATDAIRRALDVDIIFVEHNVDHGAAGMVGVVVETSNAHHELHPAFTPGAQTEWDALPTAQAHLEGGAPFFFRVEATAATEWDRSGVAGANSEVDIPIVLDGRWMGVVGAAVQSSDRRWRSDELELLRNFADLTAAFWQRIEDLRVRDSLIGSLDGRLRYEEAIAASSKALLGETGVGLDGALEAVGIAARVDEVYVTQTTRVEDGSPSAETVAGWAQPGIIPKRPVGDVTSYADMREILDAVHNGSLARVTSGDSEEMAVAIEVGDGWFGTVGFIRKHSTSPWSKRDAAFLRTIGDILGAFYERSQIRRRLEASILSKDQLIASVSHELRTPITAVVGLAEELASGDTHIGPEERTQLMGVIAQESRDMADLVDDLLVAARSEDGQVLVFPERTDLALLAASVVARLSIPKDVTIELDDAPSAAFADPVRIRQIIRNLLTNAIRYGGSHVRVTFGSEGATSFVEVFDDGQGIPDHDVEAIFEPYGRATASAVVPGSVGLGLTLSKRLAELMGGALTYVASEGCTFRLTLPRSDRSLVG